jgi:long-chain fatty acid transport protein
VAAGLNRPSRYRLLIGALLLTTASSLAFARPYPLGTGLAAPADSAQTAGSNPAGISRFTARALSVELLYFSSESRWESAFSGTGREFNTNSSGDTVVPRIAVVQPINDRFSASFTFLGTGFADDLGEWPGRYFIQSYDSVFVSAFPSLAYRIDEQWSVAASAAITYNRFEQERAVRNIFDPGFPDGLSRIEADSVSFGFGLSALYQGSERTRWGLTYSSEINPRRSAANELSGLGPNTEAVMRGLGLLERSLTIESTSPQSVFAGVYHEFANRSAVTLDLAWIDFSNFRLSEFYYDGEAFVRNDSRYDDIYALSTSYTWPAAERWMLGVGALVTNQMIDDEQRGMTLRLDAVWSVGFTAEWQWTQKRRVMMGLSYFGLGDAPVATPSIPGLGSLEGRFKSRDTLLLQLGISFGSL